MLQSRYPRIEDKLKNDEDGYKYSCPYTPGEARLVFSCTARLRAIILDITGIVCLLIFRKNKIVKNNQASLLIFMLVGSILLSSFTFLGIGYPKKWYCVLSMWLFHLGLPMILISMYVRVWRIHTIFNNKKFKKKVGASVNMKFIWPKIFVSFVVIVAFLTFRSFSTDSFTAVWSYAEVEETIISADVASITSHRCSFSRPADTMMFTMYTAISLESFFTYLVSGVSSKFQDVGYVSLANCSHLYYVHSRCESHIINKVGAEGYDYAYWHECRAYYFVLLNCRPKIYRVFAESKM